MPKAPTDAALIAPDAPRIRDLKAVIFDLDDTLVDARRAFQIALDRAFRAVYPELTNDQFERALFLWRSDAAGFYRAYTRGERSYEEQRELRLVHAAEQVGLAPPTDAEIAVWMGEWDRGFRAGWTAFPDAIPTLGWIEERGYSLGVITNAHANMQEEKLRVTGLAEHVSLLVTLDTLGFGKPDPRVFHEAVRQLGVEPSEALYVGDEFDLDAHAAKEAGLQAAWLFRPGHGKGGIHEDNPQDAAAAGVHVLGSLAQIPQLFVHHR